jgi:ABC-type branched-subunit amino acid transport system substrate-binding protein
VTRICILDLTSNGNSDLVSANLTIAIIDDLTGAITSHPYSSADGALNIGSLSELNRQAIEKIYTSAHQDQYFGGLKLPESIVTNVANDLNELSTIVENLQQLLDKTLSQDSWLKIREGLLYSLIDIDPSEPIRLVIQTDDPNLQSFPIERTSFITNTLGRRNRPISVVFGTKNPPNKPIWRNAPRLLLVFGSQKNIELPICLDEIEKYLSAPAIITPLYQPSPEEFLKVISDEKFDIIIIVGHSNINSDGTDGIISINENESISIREFTQPFKSSVERGLKLVILAGCSSIGAARALAANNIAVPNVIAFRVPVHYKVLRLFFDRILSHWIKQSKSLEIALTDTRAELSMYDRDCPGASILPILFTSAYAPPLMFPTNRLLRKRIPRIPPLPPISKIPAIIFIGLVGVMIFRSIFIDPKFQAACNSILGDGISCGEEILLPKSSIGQQIDKQAGANAIANENYPQAIQFLTKAWEEKKDPETLIMLENAKLGGKNIPIESIALSIPASNTTPINVPTAMLKAVAFAQQQWNADNHKWKLRIVLIDDKNNPDYAPKLVDNLLKRDIIAGIGSYSSVVTLPVKDIYNQHGTVLISGTSTSEQLTNSSAGTFFFRVCPNNQIAGEKMASYLSQHQYKKIALFRTLNKAFSGSMTAALKKSIKPDETNIVKESDFNGDRSATAVLKEAKDAGAQAIVMIPDAYTSENPERDRLLSIIRENNGDLPIIGNEVVNDQTLVSFSKKQLQKLVISLSWHSSSYQNNEIVTPKFWGDRSNLDHHIALNYDATQVIIKSLDKLPIDLELNDGRKRLQEIIRDTNIQGITGEISFKGSDRSRSINSLVRPKCNNTKCAGFEPAF